MSTHPGVAKDIVDTDAQDIPADALRLELQRIILNLNQLQQSFGALHAQHQRLRKRLDRIQQMAHDLASALIPDELALRMERDDWSPDDATPEELISLVTVEAGRKMFALRRQANEGWESRARKAEKDREALVRRVKELTAEIEDLKAQNGSLARQLQAAQTRIAGLMSSKERWDEPEAEPSVDEPGAPALQDTEMGALLSDMGGTGTDAQRVATIITLLVQRGTMFRDEAETILREQYGFPAGGSMRALWAKAKATGYIAMQSVNVEKLGKRSLVLLTPAGQRETRARHIDLHRSQLDELRRVHRSWEHALLILEASKDLKAHGATAVNPLPDPIRLPDGSVYEPDITAVLDGAPIYVEVERYTKKADRQGKWDAYRTVSDTFYVFVADPRAVNMILSEITMWAVKTGQEATVYIRDMSHPDGDRYWTVQGRRIRSASK